MLARENYTKENICRLSALSGNDPSLLEKTVYAFGLLEAISMTQMPFIFKGGTCLLLLLVQPRRLSTDIDIIVEPGTDIGDMLPPLIEAGASRSSILRDTVSTSYPRVPHG